MASTDTKEKKIIEAFLFAADEPLDLETLQSKVKKKNKHIEDFRRIAIRVQR